MKIFIIGFAFKGEPETTDIRGSTTIDLLNHFRGKGYKDESFFGYDPIVSTVEIEKLGITSVSISEGFRDADVVVIMNNHKSFRKMDIFTLLNSSKDDCLLMDGWYLFDPKDIKAIKKVRYIGVGCKG